MTQIALHFWEAYFWSSLIYMTAVYIYTYIDCSLFRPHYVQSIVILAFIPILNTIVALCIVTIILLEERK